MTSLVGADLWRLPVEMQQRAQWCLAGPDKAPYLAGNSGLYRASPIAGPWLNFETACTYAKEHGVGVGYIITEDDPYTCIDMDVKDVESRDPQGQPYSKELLTTTTQLNFYSGIVQFAESYAEFSTSGKGLHVWVQGSVGAGRRGKGIEVYSRERFMVCTGRPVSLVDYHVLNGVAIPTAREARQLPIANGDMILQNLTRELGVAGAAVTLGEVEPDYTDEKLWEIALNASNKDKFISLCKGAWQQFNFPSQSEADLALMSMLTFYSKSNAQCRRIFRQTALGEREKAVRDDRYLDRTLQIIRGRQEKEASSTAHGEAVALALLSNAKIDGNESSLKDSPTVKNMVQSIDQTQHSKGKPNVVDFKPPEVDGLDWPPGLTGAIAGFIYQSAPRPVKEVAIVAALGLMAGMTGKAYNVGQTGLNLYIILIARSAIGKEAMHSGIGHLLRSACGQIISPFVNFTDYASGPALTKGTGEQSSFVNVMGEWGRKMSRMADDHRDGPMQQLRTVMTNLYQKSGAASVVGGISYSNKEQNVAAVNAIAYSMIGETTPGTFYNALTPAMMEDGFLSRFNIIEYLGERPAENKEQLMEVPLEISNTLMGIASHAMGIITSPGASCIQIRFDPEPKNMLDEFNLYCDGRIREAGGNESIRQIWNRAHLKALRVSGVLAASDNHISPTINKIHATWAINLIIKEAESLLAKVEGGDVGVDDSSRFLKLVSIFSDFIKGKVAVSYKIDPRMVADGIVTRGYLGKRTQQVQCFVNYRMGSTMALDHTLKTAIDSGNIMEVNKDKAVELYGYHGRCFRILNVDK